jgi:hypothetical protein
VTQLAGSRLGYIINSLDLGDKESSFSAFNINIENSYSGRTFPIGQKSSLTVLRLVRGIDFILVFIVFIPLLIFIIVSFLRKYNQRRGGQV